MIQEFWVDVNLILKETEKVLFQERTMFVHDLTVFTSPTDNSGQCPKCDLICSKSLIRDREGKMIKALR